ncbi:cadherin repeat domain-containing protein, partial [Nitratireductor sp. ZSWI3]|uniref:cadherin repeat domain-containing protein n=1 Tax=Nitratireductor sp. ZSWI3 TaxID=2966359 RepID=UPI00214FF80E
LVVDGNKVQLIGLRFTDINIPQGATIVSAYIQFQTDEVSTGTALLMIHGEASDDAAAFTGVRYDASSRLLTDASVSWSPAEWLSKGEAGLDQRTPDLAAVIQEIVNRSGWEALNDMVFVVSGSGRRVAEAYEGTGAPVLHIEWLPASDPVAFNDPADANAAANRLGELAAAGTLVGITASAADPDAGDTVTYSLDDERFVIDADTGVVARSALGTLDHESEPSVTFTVTVTSSDGSVAQQAFTIDVLDDPEPVAFNDPPDADATANHVSATAAAGTPVGITASASDTDVGDTVTYQISDARFAIHPDTGVITRSAVGTL